MKTLVAALLGTFLIPVPQWGNVSLVEAVWLAVGVIALFVSSISLPKVIVDLIVASHAPPSILASARVLLARGHVRRELIRWAQAWLIVGIGIVAALTPNPLTSITMTGLTIVLGILGIGGLVALQSLLDKVQREHAEAILALTEEEVDPK